MLRVLCQTLLLGVTQHWKSISPSVKMQITLKCVWTVMLVEALLSTLLLPIEVFQNALNPCHLWLISLKCDHPILPCFYPGFVCKITTAGVPTFPHITHCWWPKLLLLDNGPSKPRQVFTQGGISLCLSLIVFGYCFDWTFLVVISKSVLVFDQEMAEKRQWYPTQRHRLEWLVLILR